MISLLALAAGGCGREEPPGEPASPVAATFEVPAAAAEAAAAPSAKEIWRSPDRFQALDGPWVSGPDDAVDLADDEEVLGLVVGGVARAYPLHILGYHHAVNDFVGGVPILVTSCELCSSAVAFRRTVGEETLSFAFEGVYQGTLLVRDRETGSIWLHLTGQCVAGPRKGEVLRMVFSRISTWSAWKRAHPDTGVVRPEPRFQAFYRAQEIRPAGEDYLPEYVASTVRTRDERRRPNDLVFGVAVKKGRVAYPLDALAKAGGVVNEDVAGVPVTVWLDPSGFSAVGFSRASGDRVLTFRRGAAGEIRDEQTDSVWSLDGEALSGPLLGRRLQPLQGVRTEWYGWTVTHGRTDLSH